MKQCLDNSLNGEHRLELLYEHYNSNHRHRNSEPHRPSSHCKLCGQCHCCLPNLTQCHYHRHQHNHTFWHHNHHRHHRHVKEPPEHVSGVFTKHFLPISVINHWTCRETSLFSTLCTVIVMCLVLLSFLDSRGLTSASPLTHRQMLPLRSIRSIRCDIDCSTAKPRPVCGTDGRTYPSRCEIRRLKKCEGKPLKVKWKGDCTAPQKRSRCFQEREEQRVLARKPTVGIFIPSCNTDGTYAEVQCHHTTGYCWCATRDGKPIHDTSVNNGKPNCKGKPKRRRSGKRGKKVCLQSERSTFNTNLIAVFKQEYRRIVQVNSPSSTAPDSISDTLEKRVIDWKFTQLDKDSDDKLRRKEVRSLKRMVKKLIKPRSCGKSFINYCDLDQDQRIVRREWSLCLGVDINKDRQNQAPSSNIGSRLSSRPRTSNPFGFGSIFWRSGQVTATPVPTSGHIQSSGPAMLNPMSQLSASPTDTSKPDNTDELRSCEDEHDAAAEIDRNDPDGKIFIPVCTADGKYNRAQCHKATQICWCVNESTGKTILGTSTHKVKPDCDIIKPDREMKGCPSVQKRKFLIGLTDKLIEEKQAAEEQTAASSIVRDRAFYVDVVRWKLSTLDRNGNSVLERKEWRKFKKESRKFVRKKKSLRKCGRNFLRYCDADNNNKITMDEWIDCMVINRNMYSLPANPKRKGPNPFSTYLRSS